MLRKRADDLYVSGLEAQNTAEVARADYYRLRQENRDRYAAKGQDQWTADYHFGMRAIAKDCIDTDQMCSRWATDRLMAANATYRQVSRLMDELARFMRARRPLLPQQRRAGV